MTRACAPACAQFVLNDACVEIIELAEDGFAKVRHAEDEEYPEECVGWVRTRNISRIERKAGLPDLNKLAHMAVAQLATNQALIGEMEEEARKTEAKLHEREVRAALWHCTKHAHDTCVHADVGFMFAIGRDGRDGTACLLSQGKIADPHPHRSPITVTLALALALTLTFTLTLTLTLTLALT